MSWVAVAVAGAGIAGSIYSGNQQADAIEGASNQQAASSAQQLQLQRDAQQNAEKRLQPYSAEGGAARAELNALFGLGGREASAGGIDWQAYMQRPDVAAVIADPRSTFDPAGNRRTPEEIAKIHYAQSGSPADAPRTGATGAISGADAQAKAMDGFRTSPYAKTAADSAQRGVNAIFSTQGAAGKGVFSGQTARAAADWNQEQQGGAFDKYTTALGGVADTGFAADSGIASGGMNFANGAANTLAAGSNAQTQLTLGAGQARAGGVDNALGFLGWGAGQLKKPTNSLFTRNNSAGGTSFYG